MKTFILFLLALVLCLNAYAQQSCPLSNKSLMDLRVAASKLTKTITLSPECKAYQDTINQTNAQLKDIAIKIADFDGKLGPNDRPDMVDTAAQAVAHLDTISGLFKDQRCGQQLVGFLDYVNAFVDVATGMISFLGRFGGPEAMPWVLGSGIAGAGVKTLVMFFKNKSIDMRNPDQSDTFLKNSCAFYQLNQVKKSIDDLQMNQIPTIQNDLKVSQEKLSVMSKELVPKPDSDIGTALLHAELDLSRVKDLQDQMKVEASEGCLYVKAFAAKEDENELGSLLDRAWDNYENSFEEKTFKLNLEKKYFLGELNPAVASKVDEGKCNKWLAKVRGFLETGISSLKKLAAEDKAVVSFQQFKETKLKLEEEIKLQKVRVKFFEQLTGSGFNIEFSEIIRSHMQVQDAIFQSRSWLKTLKMKGLAEAWLRVKYDDAEMEMDSFFARKKQVHERIGALEKILGAPLSKKQVETFNTEYVTKNDREHNVVYKNVLVDVCNELRRTWTSWYNGLVHARAGRDYCIVFDGVISKLDYPEMQTLCFGTSGSTKKPVRSLRNQVAKLHSMRPEAEGVISQMREYSCKEVQSLTPELLSQGF